MTTYGQKGSSVYSVILSVLVIVISGSLLVFTAFHTHY